MRSPAHGPAAVPYCSGIVNSLAQVGPAPADPTCGRWRRRLAKSATRTREMQPQHRRTDLG